MSKHDIPTYYGAEWSWIIYYLNQIVRTAEKLFLVCERYQNEHYVYTDSDGLKNDKHWGELEPAAGENKKHTTPSLCHIHSHLLQL